jgi:hypothetical protein
MTALKHGDIGGGTADVGNDSIVETGQMPRADQACRRAGQDRLDRPQQRLNQQKSAAPSPRTTINGASMPRFRDSRWWHR